MSLFIIHDSYESLYLTSFDFKRKILAQFLNKVF